MLLGGLLLFQTGKSLIESLAESGPFGGVNEDRAFVRSVVLLHTEKLASGFIFNEQVTVIAVEDEAAGEFLRVQQHHAKDEGTIFIDPSEWPALRKALDEAFASLKK